MLNPTKNAGGGEHSQRYKTFRARLRELHNNDGITGILGEKERESTVIKILLGCCRPSARRRCSEEPFENAVFGARRLDAEPIVFRARWRAVLTHMAK